ncbi:MAG: hypothetical protein GXX85_13065 [Ignavibacteria bacterium]|nr:hypothetical protein [Ignavibacteria bacterium]
MIVIFVVSIILAVFLWQYVFLVYEVKINKKIFTEKEKDECVEISVYPINSFGMKIPFKEIKAMFVIEEGADAIEIIENDFESGKFKFQWKDKKNKVTIKIITDFSLFPIIEKM